MLSLTRKADYALVAMVFLARQRACGQGPASAREIGELFDLPVPLLMNVLKQLAGAGLLASTRGAGGGYELAKPAAAVSVLDVVDAVADNDADAGDDDHAPHGEAIDQLRHRLNSFLQRMTLAELLREADAPPGEAVVPLRTADP